MKRRVLGVVLATAIVSPGAVQAQEEQAPARMRGTPPGKIQSLGGVRSQPGVKSKAPRGTGTPIQIQPLSPRSGFSRPLMNRPPSSPAPAEAVGPGRVAWPGQYPVRTIGDGLTVSGSYSDGPFKLVFTIGGAGRVNLPNGGFVVPVYTGGLATVLPYGGLGSYFSCASCYAPEYRAVVGPAWMDQSNRQEGAAPSVGAEAAEEPARPMTPVEHAAALLYSGDAKGAAAAYKVHLASNPLDAGALRGLGLSLIEAGQVGDGVAVIGMAYRSDSTLAASVVHPETFGRTAKLRSNLNRVSGYANREKSASAWLALAVLMQAEGRNERAAAMVQRAGAAGLEPQVVNEMNAALGVGAER